MPDTPGSSNPLLPGQAAPSALSGRVSGGLGRVQAQYDKLQEAEGHLEKVSAELGKLAQMGPLIDPEDVIKASGRLVAAGAVDPKMLAVTMSSMPSEPGEALAAWVQTHSMQAQQAVQKLQPMLALVRHELGVAGLRSLAVEHFGGGAPSASQPTPEPAPGPAGLASPPAPSMGQLPLANMTPQGTA